jgi:ribosomal protein RSM22 (predicted rRNA methylase)
MANDKLSTSFPDWFSDWLFQSLQIAPGNEIKEEYLKAIIALNKNWLAENYEQDDYNWESLTVAQAYALYYMPANIPKLWKVLENSPYWTSKSAPHISDITEFGCGPGTFLWSYLIYQSENHPEQLKTIKHIRGIDTSLQNLKIAEELYKQLRNRPAFKHITAEFIHADWQEHVKKEDDYSQENQLVIFGNSLIETTAGIPLLKQMKLNNLLVLEPGTSEHFKRLKELRNYLIESGLNIHFPCSGHSACPMQENNWCHFHVNRFFLPHVQRMSNAAGRRNHRHHFCAFLAGKNLPEHSKKWRILSSPRKSKGSVIRFVCNGKSLKEVVVNKKQKSDLNRDFINADTGRLAQCSSPLQDNRLKESDSFSTI